MTAWIGLLTSALLIGAIATRWPASPRQRRINGALAAAGALLPLPGGSSAAMWLHALMGTPSAVLAQLALLACLGTLPRRPERPLLLAFVLLAGEFYALALGLGSFDVYGIGYRGPLLVASLVPIGLWCWHGGRMAWLMILSVALLSYAGGLHANLWDALFDPVLVLLALAALLLPQRPAPASGKE